MQTEYEYCDYRKTGHERSTETCRVDLSHVRQGTKAGELAQPLITDKFVIKHIPFQSTQAHITFGHIGTTCEMIRSIGLSCQSNVWWRKVLTQIQCKNFV